VTECAGCKVTIEKGTRACPQCGRLDPQVGDVARVGLAAFGVLMCLVYLWWIWKGGGM